MTQPATLQRIDNIALITLNSPPVNGLGAALRQALHQYITDASADAAIEAMVIASAGKLFCGGADINEFKDAKAFYVEPSLPSICDALEATDKLVIAAINGAALGGGFELALACDYRIALPSAKVGLPEVHLGLLPGAGGTQRLPRIAGVEAALHMITGGKPVAASEAQAMGAIDEVAQTEQGEDFINAALTYARALVSEGAAKQRCAAMQVDTQGLTADFFNEFRAQIARRSHGFYAPERCIQAVEAACQLSLAEGLKKEAELFAECMATPQARAQQHLFFAERAATKVPGVDHKTPKRIIEKVAVIGSGTMGGGIAMNFINAGMPTYLLDIDEAALERGMGVIRNNYAISAKRGKLSADAIEQRMGLLTATTDYATLADADLVIEAVFENLELKQTVFRQLDASVKPGAILATNTSTLDVNAIAAVTSRPADVIGLHFFSPANVMRLLEIVRAEHTADDVIVTAVNMAQRISKVPVVVGVCFGFVGNRMLEPYGREACRLLLEGATPTQIDQAHRRFGMAMGFCSMADLAGLDVGYLVRESRRDQLSHDPSYALIADKLTELGRNGQKTGRGFYIYQGREQQEDPEVIALAEQLANELGIERRAISEQEIIERTLFTLINEGALILQEGIASRASDCDLIYCNGYGFPPWRGGPMQYADEIGLETVLDRLKHYRDALGEYGAMWFQPAPLLEQRVAEGSRFNQS